MKRRRLLGVAMAALWPAGVPHAAVAGRYVTYPEVKSGTVLSFPRDHGAHPEYRTEWWYVTGSVRRAKADGPKTGQELGFQVTFFRSRLDTDPANPSAFAARQILFGHAALSDPARGHLLTDQSVARAGLDLAEASTTDLDIRLGSWTFKRDPQTNRFRIRIPGRELDFSLELEFTQDILLEGEQGFSRKGPDVREASEYYSVPHVRVRGTLGPPGATETVEGDAWMDREWSSDYLAAGAAGWDWTGLNLDDGSAVMAFRIRDRAGDVVWAGGTLRSAVGEIRHFGPDAVRFSTLSSWRSSRSGVVYPVAQELALGPCSWRLEPYLSDQELDTSLSTGTIYWEGAVHALPAAGTARAAPGHGYLELTGYDQPLKF